MKPNKTARNLVAKSETLRGNLSPFARHLLEKQVAVECNAFKGNNPAMQPRQLEKLEIETENTLEIETFDFCLFPWILSASHFVQRMAETSALREKRMEGKRISPRKSARKDKWIDPALRDSTALRLVHYVIKRIQLPRYGEPFPLSETDKKDALQVGLLACHESGFFNHGFTLRLGKVKANGKRGIQFSILARIRNAIQGKNCLAMRCKRLVFSDEIAEISDKAGFISYHDEVSRKLSKRQIAASRDLMKVLRAARDSDPSKRAGMSFKSQRGFFLMTLGILTERTPREVSGHLFKTQKTRFQDYLSKGLQSLRLANEAKFPPNAEIPEIKLNLGEEIMQSLAMRFL